MELSLYEKLKNIYYHFGFDNQINKLKEEHTEMLEALEDYKKNPNEETRKHFIEELADTFVVHSQFSIEIDDIMNEYNVDPEEVYDVVVFKADRTNTRMKENYYDNSN